MTELQDELKNILGEDFLNDITADELYNSKKISCGCNTLILRPNHAKLILPSDSMKEAEKHIKFLRSNDKCFKNLTRGCYWLVDDIYKFEQIGYSKELKEKSGLKYLFCAECDLCPLGWFDDKTKESYLYVW